MQTIAVFVAALAVASAATVYRVPSADSAVIESHRVGGNFAYSTSEGHAVGVVSPVVQNVATPVATSYSTVAQLPVQTYTTWNGVNQVVPTHQVANVAVARTAAATNLVGGVQLVNGVNTLGLTHLNNVGVWPASTVVV